MDAILSSPLLADKQLLNLLSSERGIWRSQSLPVAKAIGKNEFLSCHICSDISCTISTCQFDSDYSSTIQYPNPTVLLIFGLQGYARFSLMQNQINCTVRAGDVWLININGDHIQRESLAGVHAQMLVVKYRTERINAAFKDSDTLKLALSKNQILRLGHMVSVNHWVSGLINNPMDSAADRLLAEARALELIARWLTPGNLEQTPAVCASSQSNHGQDPTHDQLNLIINLLVRDLSNPPSLEELAAKVGMSHTRLNRHFKKVYGTTVFDWLRNYRLERARVYLRDEQRSITQIAFHCGFSSASHFAQLFKRQYGCSPVEFRDV